MSFGPLKDLHLYTDLEEGVELLVPDGEAWSAAAAHLREMIAVAAGGAIDWATGEGAVFDRLHHRHCVILGHAFSNPAIMTLYRRQYAFADDHYPGPGGYAIRTVHNPLNCGHNAVLVAVADPDTAGAAIEALDQLLAERGRCLPYINRVQSPLAESLAPAVTPNEFRIRYNQAFEQNALRAPIEQGIDFGLLHHLTGDAACAVMFRDVLFFYQDMVRDRFSGDWCFEHMLFIYAWTWRLFYVWDLIEESYAFTQDERQRMTDLLWGLAQYVAGLPYFAGDDPPLEIRQNHSTFAALSMAFAAGYFRTYYGVCDFERQLARCALIFDGQAECYKPNDDGGGGGYCWIVPSHQLVYDLRRDDERFIRGGHLRQLADYAVLISDNLGSIVEFGDVGTYSAGRRCTRWLVSVLSQAAAQYQEGGYLWALRRVGGAPMPGCYWPDLPERPPQWMTGICVAPFNSRLYEWAKRHGSGPNARGGPEYPLAPMDKAFDKLSLRSGFEEEDFYLLLDGTSTYAHGHDDGNSVERLTWKGRMWLAETDYIWRRPRFHSTLVSICDGQSHYPPPLVALEWARTFPSVLAVRTIMAPYNGIVWTRDLFWVEERFLLVADTAELMSEADFDLRCLWRTLGTAHLESSDLTVEQHGVFFRILGADEAARSLADEEPRVAGQDPYASYAHADGPIHILSESLSLRGQPGHRERFFNLMVAGTAAEVAAWGMERAGEARVRITQDDRAWLVGLDGTGGEGVADVFVFDSGGLLTDPAIASENTASASSAHKQRPPSQVTMTNTTATSLSASQVEALRQALLHPIPWQPPARPPKHRLVMQPQGVRPSTSSAHRPGSPGFQLGLSSLWEYRLDGAVRCLDAGVDGIACGTASGEVAWLTNDGSARWRAATGAEVRTVCRARMEGKNCLLAGGRDSRVICFDEEGHVRWQRPFDRSHNREQCVNAIQVADLQGHGDTDIVVATDGWLVWCLDPRGEARWRRQIQHHAGRSLVIGDVEEDGRQEILVGTEYYTSNLLEADGRIRWAVRGGPGFNALALSDLDHDGVHESLCGSLDGNVYAVDSLSGGVRWLVNLGDEVRCLQVLKCDGAPHIVAGSDCGQVALIDANGQVRWRCDLGAAVAGIEVIGQEIACATSAGYVVLLSLTGRAAGQRELGAPVTRQTLWNEGVVVGMADGRVAALGDFA